MVFEDENPWSAWISSHRSSTFASPGSPVGGGGFGNARLPGFIGKSFSPWGVPDPHSPAANQLTLQEVAIEYGKYEVSRVLAKIGLAQNEYELSWLASYAFGPDSFSGRFIHAQRRAAHGAGFLRLQKEIVAAELYDHLTGRCAWIPSPSENWGSRGPELWQVGHHLRGFSASSLGFNDQLQLAADSRDALIEELAALFTQPSELFVQIKAQLKPRVLEHWTRYLRSSSGRDNTHHAAGGGSLGIVIAEAAISVVTLTKEPNFTAKLSHVAPHLSKLAGNLADTRASSGGNSTTGALPSSAGQFFAGPRKRSQAEENGSPATSSPAPSRAKAPPSTMTELEARIKAATAIVEDYRTRGLPPPKSPYSDEEKRRIAQAPLQEKFVVRVTNTRYATDQHGMGRSKTYWTTTYTQLEHADSDAELIAKTVGVDVKPGDKLTLIILDADQAAGAAGMKTFIPTYEALTDFALHYLENPLPRADLVPFVMNEAYSQTYAKLKLKVPSGLDLNKAKDMKAFVQKEGLSPRDADLFQTRFIIQDQLGANEHFLGNGLTKDNSGPPGMLKLGVVETFTYDKNPQSLGKLESLGLVKRVNLK